MSFSESIEAIGKGVDLIGVAVLIGGLVLATVYALRRIARRDTESAYRRYRHDVGRAILLGLEILIAADIIRTVATFPELRSTVTLALIVLVRTFLSLALELEIEGRWPWQRAAAESQPQSTR
ncbi:MAG: DUF1622 domain-containing protein [Actinobacteria bacterium]|nr:DUF1622 domain-containing protein [Actinomycetota bacterium]